MGDIVRYSTTIPIEYAIQIIVGSLSYTTIIGYNHINYWLTL